MQPSFFFVWRLGGSYGLKVLLESLFSSFDFKKKQKEDRACASLALSRRSPHEEDELSTGKRWGCVEKLVLIFSTHILLTIKGFEANRYFCVGFSFLIFPRIFC
jgi:hypothetical protein